MNPKEKARELVIKMQFQKRILMFDSAKKCALICVTEIKESLRYVLDFSGEESLLYWNEVKKEIEKL